MTLIYINSIHSNIITCCSFFFYLITWFSYETREEIDYLNINITSRWTSLDRLSACFTRFSYTSMGLQGKCFHMKSRIIINLYRFYIDRIVEPELYGWSFFNQWILISIASWKSYLSHQQQISVDSYNKLNIILSGISDWFYMISIVYEKLIAA